MLRTKKNKPWLVEQKLFEAEGWSESPDHQRLQNGDAVKAGQYNTISYVEDLLALHFLKFPIHSVKGLFKV